METHRRYTSCSYAVVIFVLLFGFAVLSFRSPVTELQSDAVTVLDLMMRYLSSLTTGSLILCGAASAYNVYDLGHSSWTVSDPGKNVSVPGRVPSQVSREISKVRK